MHRLIIALHLIVGVSAVGAGLVLVSDPSGKTMTFDTEWLNGSPFATYLVPGLFLAFVNGGLNLASAYGLVRKESWAASISLLAGVTLVAWIAIQWLIIGYRHWTQFMWLFIFAAMLVIAVSNVATRRPHTGRLA